MTYDLTDGDFLIGSGYSKIEHGSCTLAPHLFRFPLLIVSQYRFHPLTGQAVIIAESRAERPNQFATPSSVPCPFCEGNEHLTPPEIDAFREEQSPPNGPGWHVRLVPNKYPAVTPDVPSLPEETKDGNPNFLRVDQSFSQSRSPARGRHEVIVDTPRHVVGLTDMTDGEVAKMLKMYARCLQRIRAENQWRHVQIFKNVGAASGASLPHAHSQLIALPFTPSPFQRMANQALEYKRTHAGECFWCVLRKQEQEQGVRVVAESEYALALCPYASRFAGEVEILPKIHAACFSLFLNGDADFFDDLAGLLRKTIQRLEAVFSQKNKPFSYNIVLTSDSFDRTGSDFDNVIHSYLTIIPALDRTAGFEWGTGLHINPALPEATAEKLRAVILQ